MWAAANPDRPEARREHPDEKISVGEEADRALAVTAELSAAVTAEFNVVETAIGKPSDLPL